MSQNTKRQQQVIVSPETNAAYCPFCSKANTVTFNKPFWVLAQRCEHADMAVAAGGLDIAIHFVGVAA